LSRSEAADQGSAADPAQGADGAATTCDAPAAAALGVHRSVSGRRWSLMPADEHLCTALAQRHGIPDVVARILAARGVGLGDVESFLTPKLRDLLPDPCRLKDMRAGAERLAAAVLSSEAIAVFGDYDVDGATAAALLLRFLSAVGATPRLYVPDRLREGYGPNTHALLELRRQGVSLVVTLDCGMAAHEPLAQAARAGLDVVVVDHHLGQASLPPAAAVINPKRPDDTGALGYLAAVGVAFLLAIDVNRLLRRAGWYASRCEPDLRLMLDLVALGTICDVVPLCGVNRALVAQGLKVMARGGNLGLRALAQVAGLVGPPTARDVAFAIGPRINAGGRVGEADLGARLLATDDDAEASRLALRLHALNRDRQTIEQGVLHAALAQLAVRADGAPLIWAEGDDWHPGVIGIVASRLVERFQRPAVVITRTGDRAVGSGRSVRGVDLGSAINAAARAGLLLKGGGHAMAAGFTVESSRLLELHRFLLDSLAIDRATEDRLRVLPIDAVLALAGAVGLPPGVLAMLAPFGPGHPEPRFVLPTVRIAHARAVGGGQHIVCSLMDGAANRLPAIAFRAAALPLGRALAGHAGMPLHLAGRLQIRRGEGLHLVIDDVAGIAG
jgi:single-stranded-DNA-specific exonuclease